MLLYLFPVTAPAHPVVDRLEKQEGPVTVSLLDSGLLWWPGRGGPHCQGALWGTQTTLI